MQLVTFNTHDGKLVAVNPSFVVSVNANTRGEGTWINVAHQPGVRVQQTVVEVVDKLNASVTATLNGMVGHALHS